MAIMGTCIYIYTHFIATVSQKFKVGWYGDHSTQVASIHLYVYADGGHMHILVHVHALLTGNDNSVETARHELRKRYTQSRYIPPEDNWLPYHPKHYTPLTIVHHEGRCTESEVKNMAEVRNMTLSKMGTDQQNNNKSLSNLFALFDGETPAPYKFLIEGAPGIGKTILSKEIALQWAKDKI